MDRQIGILHLSDIHMCDKSLPKIKHLLDKLCEDIDNIVSRKDGRLAIDMICITGDLINSGDNSDKELEYALDIFIEPLMNRLGLRPESIFIVAGNHEVKRNGISDYVESGLLATLGEEDAVDRFLCRIEPEPIKRISYFDNDFGSMFGPKSIWENPLARAYELEIDGLKIGVSCINSAWRSTGCGESEKGKLIVGRKQINDSVEAIKTSDIKICMLHHPFDWFTNSDKIAVEKCISKYDVVLTGHIHESDTKVFTTYNGQTLFNTCGKFDNTSDVYNGYSILGINPFNKECEVILRQYFGDPRDCYDAALGVAPEGLFYTILGKKDDNLALAYNIVHAIEAKFLDYANSYFVSNVAAGRTLQTFNDSFVIPELSRYSEYEKETQLERDDTEQEEITLDLICNGTNNVMLLGKKEIGKTTILHYMVKYCMVNFNEIKRVPIVINIQYTDFAGKDVVVRAAHRFVQEFCDNSVSYSVDEIESLLSSGLCTVMFDDFEMVGPKELRKINDFIKEYPRNRFFFSEKEEVSSRGLREVRIEPDCDYDIVHICSLTKKQIRTIAEKNALVGISDTEDTASLVDKIMICFKKTTLPKTPFVLSLIMSICDSAEFSTINEAVVMEQFMECLLEKSSPSEVNASSFDFRVKEDFLIELVTYMNSINRFYLSHKEFESLVLSYHNDKGFSVGDTKFDKFFFENGILIRTELMITFRYSCMIEYYLARKMSQSSEFLSYILEDNNFLNYPDALMYYMGLNRRDLNVIKALRKKLEDGFDEFESLFSLLDEINVGINISLPEEGFSKEIESTKLSTEESDIFQDVRDNSEDVLPETIDKKTEFGEMDSFVQTLMIYGSCLKNLELIKKDEKELIYAEYMKGLSMFLAMYISRAEQRFSDELTKMVELPEKYTEEDAKRIKEFFHDIINLALPLAVQNIALENVGTTKLKAIIEAFAKSNSEGKFSRFFSVFMFSDLRLPGLKAVINQYVLDIDNKSMLKIVFFKLLYYYRFRYFSPVLDNFLENTLADINIKLNNGNKRIKGFVMEQIKNDRRLSDATQV